MDTEEKHFVDDFEPHADMDKVDEVQNPDEDPAKPQSKIETKVDEVEANFDGKPGIVLPEYDRKTEEPQADMVGAVADEEEDFDVDEELAKEGVKGFAVSDVNERVVCMVCGHDQRFRGEYEKSQAIAQGFAGWKCQNKACPTRRE